MRKYGIPRRTLPTVAATAAAVTAGGAVRLVTAADCVRTAADATSAP